MVYGDVGDPPTRCRTARARCRDRSRSPILRQWRPGPLQVVDAGLLQASRSSAGSHRCGVGRSGTRVRAVRRHDALAGTVAGIVTMPMNKEATQLSDPTFVGHTELIAASVRCAALHHDADRRRPRCHTRQHPLCRCRRPSAGSPTARVTEVIELTYETLHRFLDAAADRSVRSQPARRRARPVRDRGCRPDRAGDRGRARRPASMPAGRIPPTPSSIRPCTASDSTRSCACTTTRATRR